MSALISFGNLAFQGLGVSYPRTFGVAVQTEAKSLWPCPRNCYLGNLRVVARLGSSGDIETIAIIRVNGQDSALRARLGVGVLEAQNGGKILVSARDLVSCAIDLTGSAGSGYTDILVTAEFTPIPIFASRT